MNLSIAMAGSNFDGRSATPNYNVDFDWKHQPPRPTADRPTRHGKATEKSNDYFVIKNILIVFVLCINIEGYGRNIIIRIST